MKRALGILIVTLSAACVTRAVDAELASDQTSSDEGPTTPPAQSTSLGAVLEASVEPPERGAPIDASSKVGIDLDAATDADTGAIAEGGAAGRACVVSGVEYRCPTDLAYAACMGLDPSCFLKCASGDTACYTDCGLSALNPKDPSGCKRTE